MALKFGKYVVENEIGRGGFGRVYSAFDGDMRRQVAVKVLACESDPELLSRFQAEAGTTASLTHRNIITVYDFAQQDGCPYLVMELLHGRSLYELINSGTSLPLLDKVEIMYQVAEGLQYAHSKGVIHRDIKPGNVFLMADGKVKILDFGISRLVQRDGARRTREGDLIGTVSYMAPEIFHNHEPDKKTDIFAYGVLYYELLTGSHPFESKDPYTAMRRILGDDAPLLRETWPECPEGLEILVQHLLMRDREARFDELNDVIFETEPILRQLRQERAATLAKELGPLIQAGDYESANPRIKQILDLDPSQCEALAWRDQIRKRQNRQRADRLRQQGLEYMSAERFKEAVSCFEGALYLDVNKSEILRLLEQAKSAIERVRMTSELLARARSERKKGDIEEAFSTVSEVLGIDPVNLEAVSLCDSLRKQIGELRLASRMARAEDLCRNSAFDDALKCLDELEPELLSHPNVNKLRLQIAHERREAEKRRRKAAFQKDLLRARGALQDLQFEEASELSENLCLQYPEQAAAFELRNEVREHRETQRRKEAVAALAQSARQLMAEKRFDEAQKMLADGLQSYAGEAALSKLAQTLESLVAARQRQLTIERVLERAGVLATQGALDRALDLVGKALARLGENPELRACEQTLQQKLAEQQYILDLEKTLAEAQCVSDAGHHRRALILLESATNRFDGEPRFEMALREARENAREEEERDAVKQALRRIRSLEGEERYDEGLNEAIRALGRCRDKRELESVAERLRTAVAHQQRERMLREHTNQIRAAAAVEDWTLVSQRLLRAQDEFPDDVALTELAASLQQSRRNNDVRFLENRVREALGREDYKSAELQLAQSEALFSSEAVWISLKGSLSQHQEYRVELSKAEQACGIQDYAEAKTILQKLRTNAPDNRAARLYEVVCNEIQKADAEILAQHAAHKRLERLRREQEEEKQRRSEIEERSRRERERASAAARSEIAEMAAAAKPAGALARLERFEKEWGESASSRDEKEQLRHALEAQIRERAETARREAAERLRRQREEELKQTRKKVQDALNSDDAPGALQQLKQARKKYPDSPELREQEQKVLADLAQRRAEEAERQRREAAEQTRKKRETAIAEGRQRAAAFARQGDLAAAVSVLERLGKRYPNSSELRRDLEIATREIGYEREIVARTESDGDKSATARRTQQIEKRGRQAMALIKDILKHYRK